MGCGLLSLEFFLGPVSVSVSVSVCTVGCFIQAELPPEKHFDGFQTFPTKSRANYDMYVDEC